MIKTSEISQKQSRNSQIHSNSYVRKTLIVDSKQELKSSEASIFITQQQGNENLKKKKHKNIKRSLSPTKELVNILWQFIDELKELRKISWVKIKCLGTKRWKY